MDMSTLINPTNVVSGSIILVGALAWNETAKKFIECIVPIDAEKSKTKMFTVNLIYAIFVTLLLIVVVQTHNYISNKINGISSLRTAPMDRKLRI